jgi:predicted AlkP superfamily phosphohydrolase/phosphomutase
MEGTRAFSEELNYFPSLWLNLQGREPAGTVAAADYDRVVADLRSALSELRDPQSGAAVVRNAWRRDEIYDGPWVQFAPDLILELELDCGHSYNCMPSASGAGTSAFHLMSDAGDREAGKLSGMSGSHRADGLFALNGENVNSSGYVAGVGIADMAPTLMDLVGLEVPAEFDGRPLGQRAGADECSIEVSAEG